MNKKINLNITTPRKLVRNILKQLEMTNKEDKYPERQFGSTYFIFLPKLFNSSSVDSWVSMVVSKNRIENKEKKLSAISNLL